MRPQKKANLFLIGAAKSGTTTLAHYLQQHPDISGMAIKEPGHFCADLHDYAFSKRYQGLIQWDEAAYFAQPLAERHLGFVKEAEHYQHLVDHAVPAKYCLDASTAYLYSTAAAREIHGYAPEAKIIAILRDPAKRAYSHYTMAKKYGMELRPALQAFQEEAALTNPRWGVDECYLALGNYAEQWRRWAALFPKSQLLVLFHEELSTEPERTLDHVAQFLEIAPFHSPQPEEKNAGSVPRFPRLNAALMSFAAPLRERLPAPLAAVLKQLLQRSPDAMDEAVALFLRQYYAASIRDLEAALDMNLNTWK